MPDAQPKPTAAVVSALAAEMRDATRHRTASGYPVSWRVAETMARAAVTALHRAGYPTTPDALAEHDAQVAARALRDAADHPGWEGDLVTPVWLRRRAARIAAGEEP